MRFLIISIAVCMFACYAAAKEDAIIEEVKTNDPVLLQRKLNNRNNTPFSIFENEPSVSTAILIILLNAGLNQRRRGENRNTPLHIAAKCENYEAIHLFSKRVVPDLRNIYYNRPLDILEKKIDNQIAACPNNSKIHNINNISNYIEKQQGNQDSSANGKIADL